MSTLYTADQLIDSVKRRINLPINQKTFQDSDILAFADEEMFIGMIPTVLRLHEDYYIFEESFPLTANRASYPIPYRAIGNKIRDVFYEDSNGNKFEMVRVEIEDIPQFRNYNATVKYYYLKNNEVTLLNVPTVDSGSLVFMYYIRPNSLVKMEKVGVITDINRDTGEITLSSLPKEFSPSKLYDFIMIRQPNKIINFDIPVVSVNTVTKSMTVDVDDIPPYLAIGDHMCIAEQTAIPNLPSDLHVVLAQRAAARILEAQGDTEGLQAANAKLAEMEDKTGNLIDNRVEGSPHKVKVRGGFLKRGLSFRSYRRW